MFTERLPRYLRPWARKTTRHVEMLTSLGMAIGGRGTETVAPALGMVVSDQTVLRLLARRPEPAQVQVRVLGVDDFAFRRRRTYGTILIDLEQRRAIDLLPTRSQVTFAQWLRQHPEVRIISRDRGGDYAAAASAAAPQAEQVADRFHLLQNAGDVLDRCLTRQSAALTQAAQALAPADAAPRTTKRTPAEGRRKSDISELIRFAQGLRRDEAAVQAALRYDWSQGPVEGHVNRIKTIKRQMYGRAGFALLRRRVLSETASAA